MLRRLIQNTTKPNLNRTFSSTTTSTMSLKTYSNSSLNHLALAIDKLCPLELADLSWDNVGCMVESPIPRVIQSGLKKKVICCIDLTTEVTNQALSDPQTSLILTYHPPIFSGLKSLTLSTPLQSNLLKCITTGISIYTIHTAADNCSKGTNDFIASAFLNSSTVGAVAVETIKEGIRPERYTVPGLVGTGRIVKMSSGLEKAEVVKAVKKTMDLEHVQVAWSSSGPDNIKTVAICAGSGSSVLKNVQADLYVTGELGHHEILAANANGIHVLLCNHSASERPWLKQFAPILQQQMNEISEREEYEVSVSSVDKEPLEFA